MRKPSPLSCKLQGSWVQCKTLPNNPALPAELLDQLGQELALGSSNQQLFWHRLCCIPEIGSCGWDQAGQVRAELAVLLADPIYWCVVLEHGEPQC